MGGRVEVMERGNGACIRIPTAACLADALPCAPCLSLPGRSLLDINDLTLRVPSSGATLVSHLTLSITPGHSLLIMGPSGAGKTSILRWVV